MQAWGQQQLQDLGFSAERAQQLVAWARGECAAVVAERPPAKSLSVQMSLTPTPLAAHPGIGPTGSICGDTPGVLLTPPHHPTRSEGFNVIEHWVQIHRLHLQTHPG